MGELREVEQLYRELGRNWKNLAPWQIYVLTSHDKFDRLYGRPADKTKKLYNGMIPCYLYEFFKPVDDAVKGNAPRFDKPRFDKFRSGDHPQDRNHWPKNGYPRQDQRKKK